MSRDPLGQHEAFDPAAATALLDGDEELLRDVAGALREEWQVRSELVRRGLMERDAESVAQAVHALKGSIGQISDGTLTTQLAQMERSAVAGDLDAVETLWRSTAPEAEAFIEALWQWAGQG